METRTRLINIVKDINTSKDLEKLYLKKEKDSLNLEPLLLEAYLKDVVEYTSLADQVILETDKHFFMISKEDCAQLTPAHYEVLMDLSQLEGDNALKNLVFLEFENGRVVVD